MFWGLLVLVGGCGGALPSDESMIVEFSSRKPQLEVLLERTLTSDRYNLLIDASHLRDGFEAKGISPQDRKGFLESLRAARVVTIWNWRKYYEDKPIWFVTHEAGWPSTFHAKGYAWFAGDRISEGRLSNSLDDWRRQDGKAYRSLGGHWYIFYTPE